MTELLIFYGMMSIGLALGTGYSLVLYRQHNRKHCKKPDRKTNPAG